MTRQLTQAAQAAAQIRKHLKEAGIPASVRSQNYSMGNSVDIDIVDQSPAIVSAIKSFCYQYQYGSFDGMTDCYNYTNNRKDIPQAKYVMVNVKYSPEMLQQAYDYLRNHWAGYNNLPENYEDGKNEYIGTHWVSDTVYQVLAGCWKTPIWANKKPHIKAAASI